MIKYKEEFERYVKTNDVIDVNLVSGKYHYLSSATQKLYKYFIAGIELKEQDEYIMLPKELTAENGAKYLLSGEFFEIWGSECQCHGYSDECKDCGGTGIIDEKVPVSWTTIKDIWKMAVKHFIPKPL